MEQESQAQQRAGHSARAFLFFGPRAAPQGSVWLRRWFRWRRAAAAGLVVFLLGVSIISWVAWRRSWQQPEWWQPAPQGPEVAPAAERLEQQVVSDGHRVRAVGEAWELALEEGATNGWLSTRLVDWMNTRVPPVSLGAGVKSVRVMFRAGALYLAGELEQGRIVTVGVSPAVDERGRLVLVIRSASVGRLGLPSTWAARALQPAARAGLRIEGESIVMEEPVLKLADDRRVRITGVQVSEGQLKLTCKTLGR
jgi:hypothetical protein